MELEAVTLPVLDTEEVSLGVCVAVSDALAVTEDVCTEIGGTVGRVAPVASEFCTLGRRGTRTRLS